MYFYKDFAGKRGFLNEKKELKIAGRSQFPPNLCVSDMAPDAVHQMQGFFYPSKN